MSLPPGTGVKGMAPYLDGMRFLKCIWTLDGEIILSVTYVFHSCCVLSSTYYFIMLSCDVFSFSNKTPFGSRNWLCWKQLRKAKTIRTASSKVSRSARALESKRVNYQRRSQDKHGSKQVHWRHCSSVRYPSQLCPENKQHLVCRDRRECPASQPRPQSCHCLQRDELSDSFQMKWKLKGKNGCCFIQECIQAFPTTQWQCQSDRGLVPLLSPLNFFSSRLSCASYSLSNSICSIWASIRSLEVSMFSPEINGPSATLFKIRRQKLTWCAGQTAAACEKKRLCSTNIPQRCRPLSSQLPPTTTSEP